MTLAPPDLPLAPDQALAADTMIFIIPSGAMTFASGHTLQMETDLIDARWDTVVRTDGIPADRESGDGGVMFINGYVLSYPTNRDVSLEVTVSGTVPPGVSSITVLRVQELDNSGSPVPGSIIIVTEPVSVSPPTMATTAAPFATTPLPSPSESPSPPRTRAGGPAWPGLAVAGALGVARMLSGRGKGP